MELFYQSFFKKNLKTTILYFKTLHWSWQMCDHFQLPAFFFFWPEPFETQRQHFNSFARYFHNFKITFSVILFYLIEMIAGNVFGKCIQEKNKSSVINKKLDHTGCLILVVILWSAIQSGSAPGQMFTSQAVLSSNL